MPDYEQPNTARLATLNIRGGGSKSKATLLAPALQPDGLLTQVTNYQMPDLLWLTELQNVRGKHDDFARRFLTPDTALYITSHVALVVRRRFLGHELRVRESQDGRVLQVLMEWHGEPACFTGIYAPGFTTAKARQRFYNQLHVPADVRTQAVLGDFNHTYGTDADTNNTKAENTGLKQWLDFVAAHPLLGFTDSIHQDNAGERWYTWQGQKAWGTSSNHKRRLDRIELSSDTVQIAESWATYRPWGKSKLDHALVTVGIVAPLQRPPPLPDPDVMRPMQLHILKDPIFLKKCLALIADIDDTADARDEMDIFILRAREAHDALLRAANKGRYTELKATMERVAPDDDAIAAAACRDDDTVQAATGRRPKAGSTEARWFSEAREMLNVHANDLHSERAILEADFSHLSAKSFFQQVNVRTDASTFPYQVPCVPSDDVQHLNANMARTGFGGFRTADNATGWSAPPPAIPPPVATGRIVDQPTMLANTLLFYEWLFRERRWHEPSRDRVLAAMAAGPVFDADTAARMGANIEPAEIELALSKLAKGKAPGPNGVPSEFFIMLGAHIAPFMAKFANTVRDKGGFSELQRQGKIVLLWKNKNKGDLTCYRPLTLLQRETSVIEMVITMRLAATLPACIESDQTGYLAKDGRRMHENIIKMQDALDFTRDKDIDACAISIDAVKAFDRVSRRLLFGLYDILCGGEPGSDQPLTMWVKALMAKQERRVLVNGELTKPFTLNSGIPQGAILSVMSYTLFSESLARLLQNGDASPKPIPSDPGCGCDTNEDDDSDDEDDDEGVSPNPPPPFSDMQVGRTPTPFTPDQTKRIVQTADRGCIKATKHMAERMATDLHSGAKLTSIAVGTRTHGTGKPSVGTSAHGTDGHGTVKLTPTAVDSRAHGTDAHGVRMRAHSTGVHPRPEEPSHAPESAPLPLSAAHDLLNDWSWHRQGHTTQWEAYRYQGLPPPTVATSRKRPRAGRTQIYKPFTGLKGIRTPSPTARLSTVRYADDIVLVLPPGEVAIALDICEIWNAASGMARNDVKTEGMWIGKHRLRKTPWTTKSCSSGRACSPGDSSYADKPCPDSRITWLPPGSSLKVLGVYVGYNVNTVSIWDTIATAMFSQFRLWQLAKLGYLTRVLVCKVMVWSKAFFMASYMPPPDTIMATLCAATRCFIQRGYLPKGASIGSAKSDFEISPLFNGDAVTRPKTEGGLAMWDPAQHLKAILAKWVVLLLEPQREEAEGDTIVRWHTMGRYYINEYTGLSLGGLSKDTHRGAYALLDGKLRRPASTGLTLPRFWRQVLVAWHDTRRIATVSSPTTAAEVASMALWDNCLVHEGTTSPPRGWVACGIRYVRDIWDFDSGSDRSLAQLRARARAHGATAGQARGITAALVRQCVASLPQTWHDLMVNDRPVQHGDLYAHRGDCISEHDDEFTMGQVWYAVVAPSTPTRWQRWSALDYVKDCAPRVRVLKGAGAAGEPPPLHPPTSSKRVCYTDGGCVKNSEVNDSMQLAGAGCAVLNGSSTTATGTLVGLYCPVITDPGHPHFLGAVRGTNNTGELVGVGEALLWLRDFDATTDDAEIYVDSKYAAAVTEARWGYSSNHALIRCVQSVLVQVRAVRNVSFFWVAGHSGDKFNDVADDLATIGQDPDHSTRNGCSEGRFSADAPLTTLDYDPRSSGSHAVVPDPLLYNSSNLRCVAPCDEPDVRRMHRVTRASDGTPHGFSHTVYAHQAERITWAAGATRVHFNVRSVRNALATASRGQCGAMHVYASRVAAACTHDLNMRWPSMWREGWSAPWPVHVTDMWWKMASGGQYVAHLRRKHDPSTAFCRVCATYCDEAVLDTHRHLYYECPCQEPLWDWATGALDAAGLVAQHPASFMLYGSQVLHVRADTERALHCHEERAAQHIRASVVEAFFTARVGTMTPDAAGVHPRAAPTKARLLLRQYIHTDWYAATRAHKRHTHLVHKPDGKPRGRRPTTITQFARVWHKFARVRKRRRLEWQGPCYTYPATPSPDGDDQAP